MPSIDRRLELKEETLMAQTVWQPVVYANGLIKLPGRATLIQVQALSIESLVTISERMNKFKPPPHIHQISLLFPHPLCILDLSVAPTESGAHCR